MSRGERSRHFPLGGFFLCCVVHCFCSQKRPSRRDAAAGSHWSPLGQEQPPAYCNRQQSLTSRLSWHATLALTSLPRSRARPPACKPPAAMLPLPHSSPRYGVRYNITMAEITHEEVRSYANPNTVYASAGLLFILAFAGLSGSFSGNGLSTDLSVLFSKRP